MHKIFIEIFELFFKKDVKDSKSAT